MGALSEEQGAKVCEEHCMDFSVSPFAGNLT